MEEIERDAAVGPGAPLVMRRRESIRRARTGCWLVLAALVLAPDQASKYAVENFTAAGSSRVLIPGLLNLVHTSNPGVAFGFSPIRKRPGARPLLIVFPSP